MAVIPDQLGLFPLADTVLFPHAFLPLHVSEESSRALVVDAAAGSGRVVLGVSRPEGDLYATACVARIVEHHEPGTGTLDVVLRGEAVVRIEELLGGKPYRTARVRVLPGHGCFESAPGATHRCRELRRLLEEACPGCVPALREGWAGDFDRDCGVQLLHTVAMHLPVGVEKKVEWLACAGSLARWEKVERALREMGRDRRAGEAALERYRDLRPGSFGRN